MGFYELIEKYGKGAGDAKMKELTKVLDDFFDELKEAHREKYHCLMRRVMGVLTDGHYDEELALKDVSKMLTLGEHWSMKQVEEATRGITFPQGTTKADVYVALNAFANDLKDTLSDEEIIKAATAFWFNDKDYKGRNKIWCYMQMVKEAEMRK